jgi:hypothetical protein
MPQLNVVEVEVNWLETIGFAEHAGAIHSAPEPFP